MILIEQDAKRLLMERLGLDGGGGETALRRSLAANALMGEPGGRK